MWTIMYKIAKIARLALYAILLLYVAYIGCTPGYYGILIAEIIVVSLCVFLYIKLYGLIKKNKGEKSQSIYSYKSRYYSKWYILLLICCCVNVFSYITYTFYTQATYRDNAKFVTAISKTFELDDLAKVVPKINPIIDNKTKEYIITISESLTNLENAITEYYDGNTEEFKAIIYQEQETLTALSTEMENKVPIPIVTVFLIYDILAEELYRLIKHRSKSELEDKQYAGS